MIEVLFIDARNIGIMIETGGTGILRKNTKKF